MGEAQLGDRRRVTRAVKMLGALLSHAAGKVTIAFASAAERSAAYDFLASAAVTVLVLAQAAWVACARRCASHPWVWVPVDGSSLSISDPHHTRGVGSIGARSSHGRGVQVMTAIAVSPQGVGLGICGQEFWLRPEKPAKDSKLKRKLEQKETRFWLRVMEKVEAAFTTAKVACRPWYQLDRGGDVGAVLLDAVEEDRLVTVRAAWNRRLACPGIPSYLWQRLERQPLLGRYPLQVPARKNRSERVANMHVRACTVTLRLRNKWTKTVRTVTLGAVLTREAGTVPRGQKRIEWLLLTTAPLTGFEQARLVIEGYAKRWTIELFHHLWKSGRCDAEATRLHKVNRILKWATLLASVAMRTLQLTQEARANPEQPASTLLSRDEIDAIILLRKPAGWRAGRTPTLGQAVRWIADIGGFMNHGKNVPPGRTVIGRGLDRIASAVELLACTRSPKSKGNRSR
jgi:hypothetical protein